MGQTLHTIKRYIAKYDLLDNDSKVLIGLSGGADSVYLLRTLLQLGYYVVAVHCNFHLRGEESMRDEEFVRDLCQKLGVELVVKDFDTQTYASDNKVSVELAARELRYDYFESMREETGADKIAVAHHRDDNVETMLWNMMRGTGLRGLRGMLPQNGNVIRPLLCIGRKEIEEELNLMNQDFIVDSTNLCDDVTRNKIRLDLLPMMRQLNAGVDGNIATMMENMLEVWRIYTEYITKMKILCLKTVGDKLIVDLARVEDAASVISVVYEIVAPFGFNRVQVEGMLSALSGKEFISMGNGETKIKVKVSKNGKRKLEITRH